MGPLSVISPVRRFSRHTARRGGFPTSSYGICSAQGTEAKLTTMIIRADEAFYQAKDHGRNRAVNINAAVT
ncbi:diguanylate cyclase domain-containing protein [Paenarthrobacter sp. NPDC090522]|uniref:diguanylate cyclase domain-containing protein n=1 Tax=Paenarthrobacter sp. NPDC090522 TaxID=3364383 RepID=UPI00380207B2